MLPSGTMIWSAVACWTGAGVIAVATILGLNNPAWSRVFDMLIALATTLTIVSVVKRSVFDPRTAFRLGWDARGRHDGNGPAEVIGLEERQRA